MSRDAQTWFRKLRIGLSPVEKLIGGELAYRAQDDTHHAWPTLARLSDDTEVPKRTVQRTLDSLVEKGVIAPMGVASNKAVKYRLAVRLTIEAIPPGESDHGQNGHDKVAKMTTETMAKMATTNLQEYKLTNQTAQTDSTGSSEFEAFWSQYPRRVGKLAAKVAYAKARKSCRPEVIIAALRVYSFPSEPRYVPHPSTWLNEGRWMDEAPSVEVAAVADSGDPFGAITWGATLRDAEVDFVHGVPLLCLGGYALVSSAVEACEAAGISPEVRVDLEPVAEWLRQGIVPDGPAGFITLIRTAGRRPDRPNLRYYGARILEKGERA